MEHRKDLILSALREFVAQRPGLDPCDYGSMQSYRAESRRITRDRHHFDKLCRYVELRDSITADDVLSASQHAFSGRLSIDLTDATCRIDYTTGQYFPTEYRVAACAVLASAIWERLRQDSPDAKDIYAALGREFSSHIVRRWFK